jgi:hypothetical protein
MPATIKLALKKNVLCDLHLPNGALLIPRHSRAAVSDPNGLHTGIMVEQFHLDEPFTVELPDVEPRIPKRRPSMPDGYYDELLRASYIDATKRRELASEMIRRIRHYISNGTIELVEDETDFIGSLEDMQPEDAELKVAAAIAAAKKAAK